MPSKRLSRIKICDDAPDSSSDAVPDTSTAFAPAFLRRSFAPTAIVPLPATGAQVFAPGAWISAPVPVMSYATSPAETAASGGGAASTTPASMAVTAPSSSPIGFPITSSLPLICALPINSSTSFAVIRTLPPGATLTLPISSPAVDALITSIAPSSTTTLVALFLPAPNRSTVCGCISSTCEPVSVICAAPSAVRAASPM